jgi:hypothetical protein
MLFLCDSWKKSIIIGSVEVDEDGIPVKAVLRQGEIRSIYKDIQTRNAGILRGGQTMNTLNHQELIDVCSFVNFTLPGTMICESFNFVVSMPEAALLIKESPAKLRMIPPNNMHIEFRTALKRVDNVYLMPLLVRVDNNPSLTYVTWFNYHRSDEVKQVFEYITKQDSIHIFFYTQSIEPALTISIDNQLKLGFRMHIQILQNTIPWTIKDFERAKGLVSRRYLSTLSLWRGLKEKGEGK